MIILYSLICWSKQASALSSPDTSNICLREPQNPKELFRASPSKVLKKEEGILNWFLGDSDDDSDEPSGFLNTLFLRFT